MKFLRMEIESFIEDIENHGVYPDHHLQDILDLDAIRISWLEGPIPLYNMRITMIRSHLAETLENMNCDYWIYLKKNTDGNLILELGHYGENVKIYICEPTYHGTIIIGLLKVRLLEIKGSFE